MPVTSIAGHGVTDADIVANKRFASLGWTLFVPHQPLHHARQLKWRMEECTAGWYAVQRTICLVKMCQPLKPDGCQRILRQCSALGAAAIQDN